MCVTLLDPSREGGARSVAGMTSCLPHRCIADGIRDERECYRPFFCGVDVGDVERIEAVGDLLVWVAEPVLAAAWDDGVRGGDGVQERYAAGRFGTVVSEFQHVAFQISVCFHDLFFAFDGEVSGKDGGMPESFEPKRDASFVRFNADIVSRVDCSHFEIVFFPQDAAMDVADGDVSFAGFAEDLLPVGFAFFHRTIACPEFLDGKHFQERKRSAEMVLVGMRDDECVELAYANVV